MSEAWSEVGTTHRCLPDEEISEKNGFAFYPTWNYRDEHLRTAHAARTFLRSYCVAVTRGHDIFSSIKPRDSL